MKPSGNRGELTSTKTSLTRRGFLAASTAALLAGCQTIPQWSGGASKPPVTNWREDPYYLSIYGPRPDEKFPLPAIDLTQISDRKYLRQIVPYQGPEHAGTLVVDPANHFLYLVRGDGTALRYGVGVGKAGLEWNGEAVVQYKRQWPRWTPTKDMIGRDPSLVKYQGGMDPGLGNPLGARALYLFANGRDTLYRIHGTNEDWSIGKSISSGCIRMLNQDVIDLYDRVPNSSNVVVRPAGNPVPVVAQ
ncbi:L,D-transpeptidase [Flexibacterium corallicola]|uniref:L,D-transpeptidase n=1 Tax=Flexibacterium corallicola TaxID=3037259 RepID=UPI00286F2573|nr:L,D-transpeptidase [Pseudovibrio sp. M1P-2-3]